MGATPTLGSKLETQILKQRPGSTCCKTSTEAVIPLALRLTAQDEATKNIVSREMELYLNSGVSGILRNNQTQEVVGCFFNACWSRNPDYEPVDGVTMAEWYKTAAVVAVEMDAGHPEPIWRDLQYQHIYNIAQAKMTETDTDFAFYYGMGHVMPELRGSGIFNACSNLFFSAIVEKGLSIGMFTVNSMLERAKKGKFHVIWDHVDYTDVEFSVGGRPVFRRSFDLGGVTLVSVDVKRFKKSKL